MSAKQLDVLLTGVHRYLPTSTTKEFTVEANPGDLTEDKLEVLKSHGVNRLSMGVQTFDDRLLKKLAVNIRLKMSMTRSNCLKRNNLIMSVSI